MYNLNFISWLLNAELGNFNIFLMQFLYGILYRLLHMHASWNMEYIRLWHTDCGTHIWVPDVSTSLDWHQLKVTQVISEWWSQCFWVSLSSCLFGIFCKSYTGVIQRISLRSLFFKWIDNTFYNLLFTKLALFEYLGFSNLRENVCPQKL